MSDWKEMLNPLSGESSPLIQRIRWLRVRLPIGIISVVYYIEFSSIMTVELTIFDHH